MNLHNLKKKKRFIILYDLTKIKTNKDQIMNIHNKYHKKNAYE